MDAYASRFIPNGVQVRSKPVQANAPVKEESVLLLCLQWKKFQIKVPDPFLSWCFGFIAEDRRQTIHRLLKNVHSLTRVSLDMSMWFNDVQTPGHPVYWYSHTYFPAIPSRYSHILTLQDERTSGYWILTMKLQSLHFNRVEGVTSCDENHKLILPT